MTPRLAAAAIAALLSTALLTSCSDENDPDPESRRGIDARAYYEDYASETDYDSGGTVNYSAQAESEAGDSSEPHAPARARRGQLLPTTTDQRLRRHRDGRAVDVRARRRHRVVRRRPQPARPGLPGPAVRDPGRGVGQRVRVRRPRAHRRRPRPDHRDRPGADPRRRHPAGPGRRHRPRDRPRPTGRRSTSPWSSTGPAAWTSASGSAWCSRRWRSWPTGSPDDDTVSVVSFEDKARPLLAADPGQDTTRSSTRSRS